jgi:iron complex outermembrane receptor protein
VGNPELESERSLNAEASLRWLGRRFFASGLVFRNRIDDYIERVEVEEDLLTWVNLVSGTIRGLELQALYVVDERWRVFGSAHFLRGRDANGVPLADVPPREIQAGLRREAGAWRFEARLTHRDEKTDAGSGEKPIDSARLLSASLGYSFSPSWRVVLGGTNLLDEEYFPAADRKAPLAPGRSFSLRLAWTGGRPATAHGPDRE